MLEKRRGEKMSRGELALLPPGRQERSMMSMSSMMKKGSMMSRMSVNERSCVSHDWSVSNYGNGSVM